MLTEYKTDRHHYFLDAQGRFQGEYKSWYVNGTLWEHSFFVNGRLHGERKWWDEDGTLWSHRFYIGGELYRDIIEEPVDDKDKFVIAIETGGKWIC